MRKIGILFLLLMLSTSIGATTFQLKPNHWETLVIPANPDGYSVRELFDDDMTSLEYGQDWVIYTYNTITRSYQLPKLDDELKAGQGFWIIQTGSQTIELDFPATVDSIVPAVSALCPSNDGCFTLPLPQSTQSNTNYHLIGSPFETTTEVRNLRVATTGNESECSSGCDLDQAASADYSNSFVWAYDSDTNEYVQADVNVSLPTWQGFWLATYAELSQYSASLLFPYDQPSPPQENMCNVGIVTAENVIIPRIAKPDYLTPYTDPAFGAQVTRITQSTFGQVRKPVYSTIQAWNADESLILLYRTGEGGGYHFLIDGQSYQPVMDLDIYPSDLEEVFWSRRDPDVFFYLSRAAADFGEFKRYSVSQRRSTKITDFDAICAGRPVAGNDVHMQSDDDDLFGFRCQRDDGQYQMISYRISTDETRTALIGGSTRWDSYTAPTPAPSGDRFWFQGVSLGTDLTTVERELDLGSNNTHSNVGLTATGQDAIFQTVFTASPRGCDGDPDNGIAHLVEHNLETGSCRTFFSQAQGYPYTTSATHVSAQAYKQPGWVAVSSIGRSSQFDFFTNNQPAPALLSEIYLANTDPSDLQTCRLAHHRSYGKLALQGGYAPYFGEPHVTISPTGTRLLFGSDWYDSGSVDTYVIELPGFVRR